MKFTPLDKRIWVKGLSLECPAGKPTEDCPLNVLRYLPVAQMNEAINHLTDLQVNAIKTMHHQCYQDRLAASPRQQRASNRFNASTVKRSGSSFSE